MHGSVLGIEDAPLPAGEAPGVRGGRRRSCSGAPAGSLSAGPTARARTHAGTRSVQSPGRPGQRASITNPVRNGLHLLLGASRHHPSLPLPASAAAAPPASRARPYPAFCLLSTTRTPPASGSAALTLTSLSHPRKAAVRRIRLPGSTLSQSGSVRLRRPRRRPGGHRARELWPRGSSPCYRGATARQADNL